LRLEYEGGPQKARAEKQSAAAETLSNRPLDWSGARAAAQAAYERAARLTAERRAREARDTAQGE
jgi:hypothetical protein